MIADGVEALLMGKRTVISWDLGAASRWPGEAAGRDEASPSGTAAKTDGGGKEVRQIPWDLAFDKQQKTTENLKVHEHPSFIDDVPSTKSIFFFQSPFVPSSLSAVRQAELRKVQFEEQKAASALRCFLAQKVHVAKNQAELAVAHQVMPWKAVKLAKPTVGVHRPKGLIRYLYISMI